MTLKRRVETQAAWDKMYKRFAREWEDALDTMTHQSLDCYLNVALWYVEQSRRLIEERWPEDKCKEGRA